jgi:hypothetical protein
LLLVLALFLGGQIASNSHWHDTTAPVDADCALCMLSSANGAAAVDSAWKLQVAPFGVFVISLLLVALRRAAVRFHDSRAPPSLLNTSV